MPSWILESSQSELTSRGLAEPLDPAVQIGIASEAMANWRVPRTASLCLLFAGAAAAAGFAQQLGLTTGTVEYSCEVQQDVTTLGGLFFAAFQVLRMRPRGLLWCSPECRTWLQFLTRNTFKRWESNNYHGDGSGGGDAETANHCAIVMSTA